MKLKSITKPQITHSKVYDNYFSGSKLPSDAYFFLNIHTVRKFCPKIKKLLWILSFISFYKFTAMICSKFAVQNPSGKGDIPVFIWLFDQA